jgi:dihydrofolate reductase
MTPCTPTPLTSAASPISPSSDCIKPTLDTQLTAAAPLTMVVAATAGGVIGHDGAMPWRLSSDLVRFKKLTMGGALIMGRKTFDSIGRPLPGRETIVLTRQPDWSHAGVRRAASPAEAMAQLDDLAITGYVVGGAEIYRLMFPQVGRIWLTRVWSATAGDTRIELPLEEFRLVEVSRLPQTARDSVPTELQKWVRKKSVPKNGRPH